MTINSRFAPCERGGFPYRTPERELAAVWSVEQDGVDAGELGPEEIAERVFHHSRWRR